MNGAFPPLASSVELVRILQITDLHKAAVYQ